MKTRFLYRSILLKSTLEEVFDFFSKAENLDALTPPNLKFKILTPLPIKMQAGTLIDYSIKLFGVPFQWQTEIAQWKPQEEFIDQQIKGPYSKWIHTHSFEETHQGVIMKDKVEFASPGWILEPILHHLFIKNTLEQIFDYRNEQCRKIFG